MSESESYGRSCPPALSLLLFISLYHLLLIYSFTLCPPPLSPIYFHSFLLHSNAYSSRIFISALGRPKDRGTTWPRKEEGGENITYIYLYVCVYIFVCLRVCLFISLLRFRSPFLQAPYYIMVLKAPGVGVGMSEHCLSFRSWPFYEIRRWW